MKSDSAQLTRGKLGGIVEATLDKRARSWCMQINMIFKWRHSFLIFLSVILAMGAQPVRSGDGQKLLVRFTWKLTGYYTPLFVAKHRGYFTAEGLDVELAEGSGSETVVKLIANGNDKIGYGPATVAAEATSAGLPVIVVAVYQTKVPIGLISFPDVPLKTPKDLEGKKLGVNIGETFAAMLVPFANINGVDISKVTRVQLESSARLAQFMTRQIDVMSLYVNDELPFMEKKTGVKFNVMKVSDFGLQLLGQSFFMNGDFVKENPEAVRKLLRATAKGYADSFRDPSAAAQIMNSYRTIKVDQDVLEAQLKATLEATNMIPGRPLGWQDETAWRSNLDLLKTTNRIRETKDLSVYYTNEFLQ
jgi:NitT/TauT family transport system substrate-binding protein